MHKFLFPAGIVELIVLKKIGRIKTEWNSEHLLLRDQKSI